MVHARISTGAEQPINRDGAVSQFAGQEGDLVGRNADGDWVQADAVAEANGGAEVNASGVLAAPVTDPTDFSQEEVRVIIEANRELIGEARVGVVKYGIIIENADEDWGFTPGQPVYLGASGAYTQTPPATTGDIEQVVGEATGDGETVFVDVETGYSNVA
ncbi:hypothetical protein [Halonotius roseus]|uniref:Uncharacterized protein n=1 Tax=Halonotius roseus TaxID=2511997 RepID=A0A544QQZ0_9EURY|nr:hypothetical protein [Halonotius roseus]TQQ81858.1 hypothetical protein EWF95_02670 [Halonotius roseus]